MNDEKVDLAIEKIKAGDKRAFGVIIETYGSLALNIALPIVGNIEDAEEVVQDSFVRIFRFINQYNGASRFSSWLYKIVYNSALTKINSNAKELLRKDEYNKTLDSDDYRYEDNLHLDQEIQKSIIDDALTKIPESDRLILTLFYFGEKSIPEIAEITSWKVSKCKVKLMRARKKVAEILRTSKADLL